MNLFDRIERGEASRQGLQEARPPGGGRPPGRLAGFQAATNAGRSDAAGFAAPGLADDCAGGLADQDIDQPWEQLLEQALEIGINVDQFWHLTPRELAMHARAAAARMQSQSRRDLALAWNAAALMRVAKLPPLTELLDRPGPPTAQEIAERGHEHAELVARLAK